MIDIPQSIAGLDPEWPYSVTEIAKLLPSQRGGTRHPATVRAALRSGRYPVIKRTIAGRTSYFMLGKNIPLLLGVSVEPRAPQPRKPAKTDHSKRARDSLERLKK